MSYCAKNVPCMVAVIATILTVGCKPKAAMVSNVESAGAQDGFSKQKETVENLKSFVSKIGPNISWHVKNLIKNSPYRAFGAQGRGSFGLEQEPELDFMNVDFNSVSSFAVPTTQEEIIALNQSGGFSDSFALSGGSSHASSSSHGAKSGVPSVMKGLYDYLLCNSPLIGLYAFASTDKFPMSGAFSHLTRFAINIPTGIRSKATSDFPSSLARELPICAFELRSAGA